MPKLTIKFKGRVYNASTKEAIVRAILKNYPNEKGIEEYVNIAARELVKAIPKSTKKGISFKDAVNGANALVSIVSGGNVVQNEINRRASICSKCPKLSTTSNCLSCGFAGKLNNFVNKVKNAFGKGFTIPDKMASKYCKVCNCSLAVMLPADLKYFNHEKDTNSSERPSTCWIKNENT